MTNFWTHSVSNHSLYLYLIYELPLCKVLYQYLNKYMDNTNIFPFLAIFSQNFDYFTPKIAIFGPIQLGIIANIVS